MLIGLVGWIGSGKNTAGDILSDIGFRKESFAGPLKDAVSCIFGWDRDLLEGDTEESRVFRESVDEWWSDKFNFQVTPRLMLQLIGTECTREILHDSIWISALENRLKNTTDNVVLTDVRFSNEVDFVKQFGGTLIHIKRGEDPEWVSDAILANSLNDDSRMTAYNIHDSEWKWVGNPNIEFTINNEGTIEDLKNNLINVLTSIYGDSILNELYL